MLTISASRYYLSTYIDVVINKVLTHSLTDQL